MSKFVDELKKDIEGMEARHEQHKELRHEKHEEKKFARELKHQMKHEEHEKIFFMFYTMTFGVTLGIATSANILSMYFFYELLTLVTTPLVLHTLTREAVLASRTYLYY